MFNIHHRFEELRASGRYERMQSVIRARQRHLQGSINANLSDFGEASEARQVPARPTGVVRWPCKSTVPDT